jgi:hypothetical protein
VIEGDVKFMWLIYVEYCMSRQVDMALGHRKNPTSFDLDAKCLVFLDVDERTPPVMKLVYVQHHTQF